MKKYLIIFFLILYSQYSYAENKIIYIDINKILNESDAGIFLNKELKKLNDVNIEEFKNIENSIKSEEENILKQKNILKESDFNAKVSELREKIKSYSELKNKKNSELNKLRDNAVNKILNVLNSILTKFTVDNSISLIIDKKNIIIGKTELDVTNKILKLLNEKINKVELNND